MKNIHQCINVKKYFELRYFSGRGLDDNETTSDDQKQIIDPEASVPVISLNAFIGTSTLNTMRVLGRIQGQQVKVLIDSGSSHNFLNSGLIRKLKNEGGI